jgi:hypothetical protein
MYISVCGKNSIERLTEEEEGDELEEVPRVVVLDEEEDRLLVAERVDGPEVRRRIRLPVKLYF